MTPPQLLGIAAHSRVVQKSLQVREAWREVGKARWSTKIIQATGGVLLRPITQAALLGFSHFVTKKRAQGLQILRERGHEAR